MCVCCDAHCVRVRVRAPGSVTTFQKVCSYWLATSCCKHTHTNTHTHTRTHAHARHCWQITGSFLCLLPVLFAFWIHAEPDPTHHPRVSSSHTGPIDLALHTATDSVTLEPSNLTSRKEGEIDYVYRAITHTHTHADRHTHTHTDRDTHTQTDRQTHRQTDRQTDRDRHTHTPAFILSYAWVHPRVFSSHPQSLS